MQNPQHSTTCKVYLHPTTCSQPASMEAFQRRTGLRIVATASGNAQAVPVLGDIA